TLPMTQSQTPPNYASPSRELVPLGLPINYSIRGNPRPGYWKFGRGSSKEDRSNWPRLQSDAVWPFEWYTELSSNDPGTVLPELTLAAVGIPGLAFGHAFDPQWITQEINGIVLHAPDDRHVLKNNAGQIFLPAQLHYGLPFTYEQNSLASLPPIDQKTET